MNERDIFIAALQKPGGPTRAAYLAEVCAEHPELLAGVEGLLGLYENAESFLESQAPALAATLEEQVAERPGTMIGPYKLLQQIGEGGMGTVFMAEQMHPVQRMVALKVIKAGMDSRQVITRFEAERQALAMMDHVNIARVLDAGTTGGEPGASATGGGRPYFVMELVHGVPITKYCDDNHLTPRERLELFVPVCQAIQHAHQKGIIHRDIKPSNVMITLYDGKPVPKVIDFGVAKATEQKLTERTLFTQYGTMVGTLEYMSPEQAEMSALGVDTRSDIFSLGVLLYELLTGSTPLSRKRVREAAYGEVLRMIKEEEPPKPSTRLSDSGEALASISAQRHMEPAKLSKLMRGELDWIVMKTLEKDRNRRYESANGLAADVQCYLNDEAVQACPPSALYRFRKIARRNKGLLIAVGLVSTALIVGTVVSIGQAIRATHAEGLAQQRLEAEKEARTEATANFQKARQAVNEYFTLVSQSKLLDVPGLQPLRKQLLDAALKYFENLAQQRLADPAVRVELAAAYLRLANLFQMMGEPEQDYERAFDKGIELVEELLQEYPADKDLYLPLAGFYTGGRILHPWTVPPVTNLPRLERAAEVWEQFTRAHPMNRRFRQDLAIIYSNIRGVADKLGKPAEALSAIDKAYALSFQNFTEDPASSEYREILAAFLLQRGWYFNDHGRFREAAEASRAAIPLQEKLATENPIHQAFLADLHRWTGMFLVNAGQKDEGLKMAQRALELHRKVAAEYASVPFVRLTQAETYLLVGNLLQGAGQRTEAENAFRQGLAVAEKLAAEFPQRHEYGERRTQILSSFVQALSDNGKLKEAEQVYGQYVDTLKKQGADLPSRQRFEAAQASFRLGRIQCDLGNTNRGLAAYSQAIEALEQLGTEFPNEPEHRFFLAETYRELAFRLTHPAGRAREAEEPCRKALALYLALAAEFPNEPSRRFNVGMCQETLGRVLNALGRPREAEEACRTGVAIFEKLVAEFPTDQSYRVGLAGNLRALGLVLFSESRLAEAEETYRQALAMLIKPASEAPTNFWFLSMLGANHYELADVLLGRGRSTEAAESYRQALEISKRLIGQFPANQDLQWRLAGSRNKLAELLISTSQPEEVEKLYRHGVGFWEKLAADYPAEPVYRQQLATSHCDLAAALAGRGRLEEAEQAYERGVDLWKKLTADFPKVADYRDQLGQLYTRRGQWEKAIVEYTQLIELQPDRWESRYGRGLTYLNQHLWDKALTDFSKAIELNPQHANPWLLGDAWHHRADVYGHLGHLDKQVAGYTTATELAPGNYWHWLSRGQAYANQQQWPKAVADCTRAITLKADLAEPWQTRGHAQAALGQWDKARSDYAKLIELAPKNAVGHNNLAWLLATCSDAKFRNPAQAVQLAKKAVELAPKDGNHSNTLGAAHYYAGNWKDSIAALQKSMELRAGGDSFDWLFLAMAHGKQGDNEEARKWYDKAVAWMEKNKEQLEKNPQQREELQRFCAEAKDVLGLKDPSSSNK